MKKLICAVVSFSFVSTVFVSKAYAIDGHRSIDRDFARIGNIALSAPQLNNSVQQSLASLTQFVSYDLQQAKLNTGKLVLRDSLFLWISK